VTPPQTLPEATGKTQERLQAIYERARASFVENLAAIDTAVSHLKAGTLDEGSRSAAERAAHRLAGTAGTVGYPDATGPSRLLEYGFATDPHPDRADFLATEAAVLRGILFGSKVSATELREPEPPATPALALHAAHDLEARIRATATARGLAITDYPPAVGFVAAIVDLTEPNGESLIRGYTERRPSVPVLALADTTSLTDRLVAARAGASLVLPRTGSPIDIVAAVQSLARQHRDGRFRILAVDDDPVMLAALPAVLAAEPIEVTTLEDPRKFWATLEHTVPDLVVLDLDMPHLDGIALCRIIRTDPGWSTLPVVFLTARTDPAAIDAVFAAGADDYVSKPLVASEVRARIRNRLDRVALYRQLADSDPLTGLANRRRLQSDFDRLCALAGRHSQPLSLALLDIDHFKLVNDVHGHGIGDLVIRWLADRLTEEFRGEDVVARWGGEEFAIVTLGMSAADASRRLAGVLESIRGTPLALSEQLQPPLSISFSAGVAELGSHGDDLRALTQAADAALYRAKRSGRARVLQADDQTSTDATVSSSSDE
jgi:diguanylate cyclase (GGDEF)-like protein